MLIVRSKREVKLHFPTCDARSGVTVIKKKHYFDIKVKYIIINQMYSEHFLTMCLLFLLYAVLVFLSVLVSCVYPMPSRLHYITPWVLN